MNQIFLNGFISDVKTVNFKNGSQVVSFSLATNSFYNNKEGEKQTITQWHNIKIFGKLAENAEKLLTKGDKVLVNGTLKYDEFEKEGIKKTIAFIEALSFEKQNYTKQEKTE